MRMKEAGACFYLLLRWHIIQYRALQLSIPLIFITQKEAVLLVQKYLDEPRLDLQLKR